MRDCEKYICKCFVCEKYLKINGKRYSENICILNSYDDFYDNHDMIECEGYYKNNIKYECENKNNYCGFCGFEFNLNNVECMEDFDKMFHLYNEHICVCGEGGEKYCNKLKHCNGCEFEEMKEVIFKMINLVEAIHTDLKLF
jgi:hypothetical protein